MSASLERRTITVPLTITPQQRSDGGLRLKGRAVVYGSVSEPLPFREVLEPGCCRRALEQNPDIFLVMHHDMSRPLARTKAGSLTVREDSQGISFEADLPDTQDARDVVELARAGVISSMSFAFAYAPGGYRTSTKDGETYRHVSDLAHFRAVARMRSRVPGDHSLGAVEATRRGSCSRREGAGCARPARPAQGARA